MRFINASEEKKPQKMSLGDKATKMKETFGEKATKI
jgi:hypothetical protein